MAYQQRIQQANQAYHQQQFMQMMMSDPQQQTILLNMTPQQRRQYIQNQMMMYLQRVHANQQQQMIPIQQSMQFHQHGDNHLNGPQSLQSQQSDEVFIDGLASSIVEDPNDWIERDSRYLVYGFTKLIQITKDLIDIIFRYFFIEKVEPTPLLSATHYGYNRIILMLYFNNKHDLTADGLNTLQLAAKLGHYLTVRSLIQFGVDVTGTGKVGETPLSIACTAGHYQVLPELAKSPSFGPDHVNTKCNHRSALWIASFLGHSQIVEWLIVYGGADVHTRASGAATWQFNQCTPLYAASANNHVDVVELLLNYNAHINDVGTNQQTPLWIAAQRGHTETVQGLLSSDDDGQIDIDAVNVLGESPLYAAVVNNHRDVVHVLLSRGANINFEVPSDGNTPLMAAIARGHLQITRLLMTRSDLQIDHQNRYKLGETALFSAAKKDRIEVVRLLLNRDSAEIGIYEDQQMEITSIADPNVTNYEGQSPLWIAASEGNVECMRYLIEAGATINFAISSTSHAPLVDIYKEGSTPLLIASENGHDDAVDLLLNLPSNNLDIGSNITINATRTHDGATPLFVAAAKGNRNIAGKLLDKGADPTMQTHQGMNALLDTASKGQLEVIQMLHEHLLKVWTPREISHFVNTTNNEGMTPLHLACIRGHDDTVEYLVEMKVDMFRRNKNGSTALEEANRMGHYSIARWLSNEREFVLISYESQFQDCTRRLIAGFLKSLSSQSNITPNSEENHEIETRIFYYFYDEHTDQSLLLKATRYGYHRLAIKWWPSFKSDKTPNGESALQLAISLEHEMTARSLLEAGADIDELDPYGRTALQVAAKNNDIKTVRSLIAYGANVNGIGKIGRTPLMMACTQGHYHVVKMLLTDGLAGVDVTNSFGWTALYIAVNYNHVSIVKLLLKKHYADANKASDRGRTPLWIAVSHGNVTITRMLLSSNAEIDVIDLLSGTTVLMLAAKLGNLLIMKTLCEHMKSRWTSAKISTFVDATENEKGFTALHFACDSFSTSGNIEVVKYLVISMKADVFRRDHRNQTASHYLPTDNWLDEFCRERIQAYNSKIEGYSKSLVVRFVQNIERRKDENSIIKLTNGLQGVDLECLTRTQWVVGNWIEIYIQTRDQWLPAQITEIFEENDCEWLTVMIENTMMRKVQRFNQDVRPLTNSGDDSDSDIDSKIINLIFRYFYDDSVAPTPLLKSTFYGYTRMTMELWPSFQSESDKIEGCNAWHLAAKQGHYLTVRALMACGVNVNQRTSKGNSALIIACAQGHDQVVEELLKSPVIVIDYRNAGGRTAMYFAAKVGHLECARLLITRMNSSDGEEVSQEMNDLLWTALMNHHLEIAELLIIHGSVDVNTAFKGWPALFVAATAGNVEMTRLLLQHGANVNAENARGQTPLHIAVSIRQIEVVHVLLSAPNLEINRQDQSGKTALMIAVQENHMEIVRVLLNQLKDDVPGTGSKHLADRVGDTPLSVAASLGNFDCVRLLIENGADINSSNMNGITPLMEARRAQHADIFRFLLNNGASTTMVDSEGMNILMQCSVMAVKHENSSSNLGDLKMLKILYKHCATNWVRSRSEIDEFVNIGDAQHQRTALHFASEKGYENVVKYLVETVKIDVLRTDVHHATARGYAIANGHKSIAYWLAEREDSSLSEYDYKIQHHIGLLIAGYFKRAESKMADNWSSLCPFPKKVNHLVFQYFYDSDRVSTSRKSPILRAEKFGFTRLTMEFLPIFKNDVTEDGMTVFQFAASLGHFESVQALALKMEMEDIKAQAVKPLYVACEAGNVEIVRALLCGSFAVDIDWGEDDSNEKQVTPLWIAARNGHSNIVELLLNPPREDVNGANPNRYSADPNRPSSVRSTPLWVAASVGNVECVKCLLDSGADINRPSYPHGTSPWNIACQHGHSEVVDVLFAAKERHLSDMMAQPYGANAAYGQDLGGFNSMERYASNAESEADFQREMMTYIQEYGGPETFIDIY